MALAVLKPTALDAVATEDHLHLAVPSRHDMEIHLRLLVGQATTGRIEIAWTDPRSKRLQHARQFDIADLGMAIDLACRVNQSEFCNVYVGAALRKPDTYEGTRADDSQFFQANALHVDFDEPGAFDAARAKIKAGYPHLIPKLVVFTGQHPHVRAQIWWTLSEPVTDPDRYRNALSALAKALGGDPTVVNPSRVMRLAGTIAWPVKEGRITERTSILDAKNGSLVAIEAIEAAFSDSLTQAPITPGDGLYLPAHIPVNLVEAIQELRAETIWHDNMVRCVAHWVARGLTDFEIA